MADLTDQEAHKLFNQTSKALRDSDDVKLSELMDENAPLVETPIVETPAIEEPVKPDDEKKEDGTTDVVATDTPDPLVKADDATDTKVEPTELDKLREQLEKISKENHALRSQAGRVPSIQRKIKDLDKKLEELDKLRISPSSQPSTKIQPKITELLKGVRENDPELADTIAAAIATATEGMTENFQTGLRDNIQLIREQEYSSYQEGEMNRLLDLYPNAPDVFQSPSWVEWKKEQSARVLGLAESDTADDVAFAFEKYAKDMTVKYPELVKVEDKKVEPTTVVPDVQADKARQVEAERLRKKETAVNIGSTSAAGKVGLPDDPEALFKKLSEEIRKTISG